MAITDQDIIKLKKIFATKDDLKIFATKEDLKRFATKEDLKKIEARLEKLEARFDELAAKVDKIYDILTDIAGQFKNESEDREILAHQVSDHEDRLQKVETKLQIA